jgi:hypothetical protein
LLDTVANININYWVKIVVMGTRPCNVLYTMTQPAEATAYGITLCTWNKYRTMREPDRLSGWENESSQITTTIEIDSDRKPVELVQMVSRPLLTLVQNESIYLLLFSLARRS